MNQVSQLAALRQQRLFHQLPDALALVPADPETDANRHHDHENHQADGSSACSSIVLVDDYKLDHKGQNGEQAQESSGNRNAGSHFLVMLPRPDLVDFEVGNYRRQHQRTYG